MSSDDKAHKMKLRGSKRGALTDISNKTGGVQVAGKGDVAPKKRMVSQITIFVVFHQTLNEPQSYTFLILEEELRRRRSRNYDCFQC
jgi:hypothetical protein